VSLINFLLSRLTQTTTAPKVEEKKGGMFCGMSLSEALIAVGILALFFFFVVSPTLSISYLMLILFHQHFFLRPRLNLLLINNTPPPYFSERSSGL
jgi:hypothetical protein